MFTSEVCSLRPGMFIISPVPFNGGDSRQGTGPTMNTSLFPVLPRRPEPARQNRKKGGLEFGDRFPRAALVPRLPWAIIVLPFQGGRWSFLSMAGAKLVCNVWEYQDAAANSGWPGRFRR